MRLTKTIRHGDRLTWICRLFGHWMKWESLRGIHLDWAKWGECRICRHTRATEATLEDNPRPLVHRITAPGTETQSRARTRPAAHAAAQA